MNFLTAEPLFDSYCFLVVLASKMVFIYIYPVIHKNSKQGAVHFTTFLPIHYKYDVRRSVNNACLFLLEMSASNRGKYFNNLPRSYDSETSLTCLFQSEQLLGLIARKEAHQLFWSRNKGDNFFCYH